MKKSLILLAFFFLQNTINSQVEFAPDGAEWCFKYEGGFLPYTGFIQCAVRTDTVVQSTSCKVLSCNTVGYLNQPCCDTIYYNSELILCQSSDSIFRDDNSDDLTFLFKNDLALNEVTLFPTLYNAPLKVEEVEIGNIGNVEVKNFKLHNESDGVFASNLYDRIGPDRGFFEHWGAAAWDGNSYFLRWYKDAEIDTLFVASEPCGVLPVGTFEKTPIPISVSPNPVSDFLQLNLMSFPVAGNRLSIFDLQGKELMQIELQNETMQIDVSQLVPGMYFGLINGKKQDMYFKFIKN